jgi:molybdopterin/thiamine biosynthesis adenylyltransferase
MRNRGKLLVVGLGGIGSWLIHNLQHYKDIEQLPGLVLEAADPDIVEDKNIKYQNYLEEDILDYKADAIEARYEVVSYDHKILKTSQLSGYDCIISAVDNTTFRRMLFKHMDTLNTYWIDLRSEGQSIAFFTKHKANTLKKLLSTVKEDAENGSCQLEYQLEQNIIQGGNRIIAEIGAQLVLNWYRGEQNPSQYIQRF